MLYQQNLRWRKNYYAKWTNSVYGVPTDSNLPPLALIIPDSFIVFLLTLQNLSIFHRFFFFLLLTIEGFLPSFFCCLSSKQIHHDYLAYTTVCMILILSVSLLLLPWDKV